MFILGYYHQTQKRYEMKFRIIENKTKVFLICKEEEGIRLAGKMRLGLSSTEMGRKSIVPYALYRTEGYISANLAKRYSDYAVKLNKEQIPETVEVTKKI